MTKMRRLLDGGDSNEFERWLLKSAADERPASFVTSQMRTGLGLSVTSLAARVSSISSMKLTLLAVSLGTLMGVHNTEKLIRQRPTTLQTYASVSVKDSLRGSNEFAEVIPAVTPAPADKVQDTTAPLTLTDTALASNGTKSSASQRAFSFLGT